MGFHEYRMLACPAWFLPIKFLRLTGAETTFPK